MSTKLIYDHDQIKYRLRDKGYTFGKKMGYTI